MALLHHDDAVAISGGEAEVVSDQDRRHAALARQFDHEVHHRLLRGDVEARGRLVGDEELRPAGKRKRDDDALTHAAGQLKRISVVALLGIGDADAPQRIDRLFLDLARRSLDVIEENILDLPADLADWIERRARVLENHRHFPPAQVAHFGFARLADVDAAEEN